MKHLYTIIFTLLISSNMAQAQKEKSRNVVARAKHNQKVRTEFSPFSLSCNAGLTQFFGELNEQDMKGSIAFGASYDVVKPLSVGLNYSVGKIGGQKQEFFNSYFINEYSTVEFLTKWNLVRQFSKNKSSDVDLKVYAGLGLMKFNARAYDIETNELIRFSNSQLSKRNQLFLRWGNPKGKAGIKKTNERVVPLGVCLDYILLERWKVGMDYRFYFVRTDKADATSGQRLINPEEQDSYSNTPNDKFSLLSVSLKHRFIKRHRHRY